MMSVDGVFKTWDRSLGVIVRPMESIRVANPACITDIDPSVVEINEGAVIPLAAASKVIIGV